MCLSSRNCASRPSLYFAGLHIAHTRCSFRVFQQLKFQRGHVCGVLSLGVLAHSARRTCNTSGTRAPHLSIVTSSIDTVKMRTRLSACRHDGQLFSYPAAGKALQNLVSAPRATLEICMQSVNSRGLVIGELSMGNQKSRKCSHIPCLCDVPNGQQYCGDACREAGGEDVEIACQCDHLACPLTFRQFADLAS